MTTNRFSPVIALSIISILAVLSVSMLHIPRTVSAPISVDQLAQREGEWAAGNDAAVSYDAIELQRTLNTAAMVAKQAYLDQRAGERSAGFSADTSYDAIEQVRTGAFGADAAEQARLAQREGEWNADSVTDRSYDSIELLRAQNTAAAQAYLNFRRGEWSGK